MQIEEVKKIIKKKVEGKIVPRHDAKGHHYLIGDKLVDSVTTKIVLEKPHLLNWAVKLGFEFMEGKWASMDKTNRDTYLQGAILAHTEVKESAGNIGSQAHNILENWTLKWIETGVMPELAPFIPEGTSFQAIAAARSGVATFHKSKCIPVASEILVGSKRHNSAGTLDMLVYNPEEDCLELWDWKSSNAVNDGYAIQVSAYKKFFELMTKLPIAKVKIMHLSKEYDKFTVYNVPDIDDAFKAFVNISKVYDWLHNNKKKLEKDIKTLTI
jgi:hypothetical protein